MKFNSIYIKAIFVCLTAGAHVTFLFLAYYTGLFGMALPYMLKTSIWLGCSSVAAGIAYYFSCFGLPALTSRAPRITFALIATCISLYVGVFLAFNSFGT